jgi:DNA repair exonuclease SbcCD ATPase subunit
VKLSKEELEAEILDAEDYLRKVEAELQLRQAALKENQKDVTDLEGKLARVTVEGGLRRGRVQSLQSIDSFRRDVKKRLRKLKDKEQRLKDDFMRAEERRVAVVQEIEELKAHGLEM